MIGNYQYWNSIKQHNAYLHSLCNELIELPHEQQDVETGVEYKNNYFEKQLSCTLYAQCAKASDFDYELYEPSCAKIEKQARKDPDYMAYITNK